VKPALFSLPRQSGRDRRGTTVRFLEGLDGNLSVLEVETKVRSGLLPTLVDVFVAERLQIVQCEVQASGDRVRDRFRLVEFDGGSIAPSRWLQIQTHVLDAIAKTAEPIVASA
jgi:UTP:GlnB (protein PII) uridylyltransferase